MYILYLPIKQYYLSIYDIYSYNLHTDTHHNDHKPTNYPYVHVPYSLP